MGHLTIVMFIMSAIILVGWFFWKLLLPRLTLSPSRPRIAIITLCLLFLVASITPSMATPSRLLKHSRHKNPVKSAGKWSGNILATSAAFLGLDLLAEFFRENPDATLGILIAVIGILTFITLTLLYLSSRSCRHRLSPSSSPPQPTSPPLPLTEIELNAFRTLVSGHH